MPRRHGWQAPLDPHQVGAILVFSCLIAGCYALYFPTVDPPGAKWALLAIYTIVVVAVVSLNIVTSWSDPSDPGLYGATHGEYFCHLCNASVSRSSKHCRACDRCVEGFDHHCKWLNNCVGAKNYRYFFWLVTSTICLLLVQLAWGIWLFAKSFYKKDAMKELIADSYNGKVNFIGWQVALALYMVVLAAAVVMLGELFFFHLVLLSKDMTTYDYIIAQQHMRSTGAPAIAAGRGGNSICKPARVHDEATREATVRRAKPRVGLNPCAALSTVKPQGDPRSWDRANALQGSGPPANEVAADTASKAKASMPVSEKASGGLEAMVMAAARQQQEQAVKGAAALDSPYGKGKLTLSPSGRQLQHMSNSAEFQTCRECANATPDAQNIQGFSTINPPEVGRYLGPAQDMAGFDAASYPPPAPGFNAMQRPWSSTPTQQGSLGMVQLPPPLPGPMPMAAGIPMSLPPLPLAAPAGPQGQATYLGSLPAVAPPVAAQQSQQASVGAALSSSLGAGAGRHLSSMSSLSANQGGAASPNMQGALMPPLQPPSPGPGIPGAGGSSLLFPPNSLPSSPGPGQPPLPLIRQSPSGKLKLQPLEWAPGQQAGNKP